MASFEFTNMTTSPKPRVTLTNFLTKTIAGGLTLLIVVGSHAQGGATKPTAGAAASKGGGSKKTTINFEDQLIEGQAQKPELFYLLQQRNNNFKRLIRLRENFLPEMRKTSEDVGRTPGGKGSGT